MHDVNQMDESELYDLYGIELMGSGEVYDTLEHKTFQSLSDWAIFTTNQDDVGSIQRFGGKDWFDDD